MLRIQRALILELISVFLLLTNIVTGAVFVGSTLRFVNSGGSALGSALMLELLPKLLPIAVAFSLPFSWLASVAFCVGRWTSDHEVTALRAAGTHVRVLAVPVLALSALLAVGAMWFNGYIVPRTHREVRTNLSNLVPQFLSSLGGADRSISMKQGRLSFDRWENGVYYNIELDRRGPQGALQQKVIAREMRLDPQGGADGDPLDLNMILTGAVIMMPAQDGGWQVAANRDTMPMQMGQIEQVAATAIFNEVFGARRFLVRPKDMDATELAYVIARGGVKEGAEGNARVALNGRLSLGASVFFMGWFSLALLLAIGPPVRRVRDFMLCFVPSIFVFFPLYVAGPPLARRGVEPWLAMWLPNLVLGAAAMVLTLRAARR